ncbi:MAG: hypothetical protein IAB16_03280 [Firmicutes bacterium]|uniref:Lecithin:cholesterol acyltransferase n=1 Tax=Candidatus Stercoripulliclostridium pullicola TaxID=2840953 RepID=A0A940DH43_9FIRM|nr:hypothetical protein [Candidatus Stercoripulliclostridium pullicola]
MKNSAARRRFNVFVAVLLTVVTLAVFGCALWYGMRQKPKRGIVIVTALLSGGLVELKDDGTETVVWDPVPMEEFPIQEVLLPDGSLNMSTELITEILNSFENGILDVLDLVTGEDGFINALKVDKNTGKSVRNIKPATSETDSHVKYGVLNVYKQTYDSMVAEYGDEAEISVFNYDWRLDNAENGRLLEEYINSKGYDEVILTSHSMGGNVVSCYLARSEENRAKVKLYCAYAPSLLGSVDALAYIEDPMRLGDMLDIDGIKSMLPDAAAGMVGSIVETVLNDVMAEFIRGFTSMYQLFPSPYLMESAQYSHTGSDYMITIDGEPIETREELIEFYASRPWAFNEDGEPIYVFQKEANGKTRLENFFDSAYVATDAGLVHSTTLVNTVYFVGTGISGRERATYITDADGNIVLDRTYNSYDGDNMVLVYSATAALGPDAPDAYVIDNGSHGPVGISFDALLKEKTFEEINKVWTK